MRGQRPKSAIFARRRSCRIFFSGDELHIVEGKRLGINRLLDQVAVLVTDVLKFFGRNANKKYAAIGMAETGRLQPCLKRLANHLLLEGRENLQPWIESR